MYKRSISGLNYYRICFYDDSPMEELEKFIQSRGKQEAAPVRWAEITVVYLHCDKRLRDVRRDDAVLIDVGRERPVGMLPPEMPQLAYLLFVLPDVDKVNVLGLLERTQFVEVINREGYATYRAINRFAWARPGAPQYEFPLDAGYYEDPAHFQYSLAEQQLAADTFFGRLANTRSKELGLPCELELMRLGFFYTSLLTSVNTDMIQLFESVELGLLWDRLRELRCHLDRARFALGWFPGLLTVHMASSARLAMQDQLDPASPYAQVLRFYRQHWKTDDPAVLYEGDAQHLVELTLPKCPLCDRWDCARLPVANGRVTFGHMELSQFLTNHLRKQFSTSASWANSSVGTIFADQLWFTDDPFDELMFSYKRIAEPPEQRKAGARQLLVSSNRALAKLSSTEHAMVMHFGRPYIDSLRESLAELGERRAAAQHHVGVQFEDTDDVLLESREELLHYAEQYWPPCLVKLVKQCRGQQHLKHPDRRRVSALLKLFGYRQETAQRMFWLMFADTQVEGLSTEAQFLEGKRGIIVANDYASQKSTNLGVSCRTLIGAGHCPFAQTVDIEELARTNCSAHMNELRVGEGKLSRDLYKIASPTSYYKQRRHQ